MNTVLPFVHSHSPGLTETTWLFFPPSPTFCFMSQKKTEHLGLSCLSFPFENEATLTGRLVSLDEVTYAHTLPCSFPARQWEESKLSPLNSFALLQVPWLPMDVRESCPLKELKCLLLNTIREEQMAHLLTEKMLFSLGSKFPPSTWHPRQLWQLHLPTLNSSGECSISLIEVKLTPVITDRDGMLPVIILPRLYDSSNHSRAQKRHCHAWRA